MPIIKKDRFFGEGLSTYGTDSPQDALNDHRNHVRKQRLHDAIGKESKLDAADISNKFGIIKAAIEAADNQVESDNRTFIQEHGLVMER